MTNKSPIEVMARAMCRKDCELYGWTDKQHDIWWFKDPSNTSQDEYRDRARAALQALLEAGPTEAMIDAGLSVADGGLDDTANRHWCREEFIAMLRAALEDGNGSV